MRFNQLVTIVISVLTVITVTLLVVVESKPLQVTSIQVAGEQGAAEFLEQAIKLSFSHPIDPDQVAAHLRFSPEVGFHTVEVEGGVWVVVEETLVPEQQYSLILDSSLTDDYGRSLDR